MNTILWFTQVLLSIVFLLAGFIKIALPKHKLREKIGEWLDEYRVSHIKLIGLSEVLGAFGLILPMALNILPALTPIAAFGLVIAMIGGALTHLKRKESIITNVVLSLMAVFVMIGRIYIVPVI